MLDVIDLDFGIDPALDEDGALRAVGIGNFARDRRKRPDIVAEAFDIDRLATIETKRLAGLTGHELKRDDAHADQVRAVDALEAFGDHGFHAEEVRTLGGPVAR